MKYCNQCGNQLEDNAKFCSSCGAAQSSPSQGDVENKASEILDSVKKSFDSFNNTPDTSNRFESQDILDNKGMAVLAYLSVLVLIPLTSRKNSPYARFHTNQGLILLICRIITSVVCSVLGSSLLQTIAALLWLMYVVIGIQNALNGRAKELPIIGKYTILK